MAPGSVEEPPCLRGLTEVKLVGVGAGMGDGVVFTVVVVTAVVVFVVDEGFVDGTVEEDPDGEEVVVLCLTIWKL